MTTRIPIALTIAGSDSSGGAGIQADLKTFAAYGVYGSSVLTALTAQNTVGVQAVHAIPPEFVGAQLDSVFSDLDVGALKTGMLANAGIIHAICAALDARASGHVVVDPVMVATSGDPLLEPEAESAMKGEMLPRATLITPNLPEAARLLGTDIADSLATMEDQARALHALGPGAVLLKGGHAIAEEATDVFFDGTDVHHFSAPWVESRNTHGTGCTLSAAITAGLARGRSLRASIASAKQFTAAAIARAATSSVGKGRGPLIHNPPDASNGQL